MRKDQRARIALQRPHTMAEQLASNQFKNTFIFEPFAGMFGVTTMAAMEFGWTCSQPLDLLDGFDLLSAAGRRLIEKVLTEHKPLLVVIAFDCRIWSLLTNLSPHFHWEEIRQGQGRAVLRLVLWDLPLATPGRTVLFA